MGPFLTWLIVTRRQITVFLSHEGTSLTVDNRLFASCPCPICNLNTNGEFGPGSGSAWDELDIIVTLWALAGDGKRLGLENKKIDIESGIR
jgi:hypothetical protein